MGPRTVELIGAVALALSAASPALAQRLAPPFPTVALAAPPTSASKVVSAPPGICASPVVRTLLGVTGGALAGYLAYQVVIGAWIAEDDARTRRIRTISVVSGAGLGVVMANMPPSRGCRRRGRLTSA